MTTTKLKEIVLFHSCCTDGLTAAYQHFACRALQNISNSNTNVNVIPEDLNQIYNQLGNNYLGLKHDFLDKSGAELASFLEETMKINLNEIEKLYTLDIALNKTQTDYLLDTYPNLKIIIIDHHISMEKDVSDYKHNNTDRLDVVFNKTLSGAALSYFYFNEGNENVQKTLDLIKDYDTALESLPLMIRFIHERDTFKFSHPQTKQVAMWLQHSIRGDDIGVLLPLHDCVVSPKVSNEVQAQNVLQTALIESELIMSIYQTDLSNLKAMTQRMPIGVIMDNGEIHHGWAFNSVDKFVSDLGNQICHEDVNRPFAVYSKIASFPKDNYNQDAVYANGMRSTDTFAALPIAQQFGGGGHLAACAFRSPIDKSLIGFLNEENQYRLVMNTYNKLLDTLESSDVNYNWDKVSFNDFSIPQSVMNNCLKQVHNDVGVKSVDEYSDYLVNNLVHFMYQHPELGIIDHDVVIDLNKILNKQELEDFNSKFDTIKENKLQLNLNNTNHNSQKP